MWIINYAAKLFLQKFVMHGQEPAKHVVPKEEMYE